MNKRILKVFLYELLISILMFVIPGCLVNPHAKSGSAFVLYVSPVGSDSNDGTRMAPLATLNRADTILNGLNPEADVEVRVIGNNGSYIDQTVQWTYYNPDHSTTIEGYPPGSDAEFTASRDNPPDIPFFSFYSASGENTNIRIQGITVNNYVTRAIEISGDRENPSNGWNGNNRISDCTFINIGNARLPASEFTYSVIALVNSRNDTICHCLFQDIANSNNGGYPQTAAIGSEEGSELSASDDLAIIGIYLAHYSKSNIIGENVFADVKGDCIRIRDYSNENIIERNEFDKCGWKAICTMWYCNSRYTVCTKQKVECPSYENILRDNTVSGNWICEYPELFVDLLKDPNEMCRVQDPSNEVRIHINNNQLSTCSEKLHS